MSTKSVKMPPCAIDLERYVIGAIITDRTAFAMIADILSSDMFYKHEHSVIFDIVSSMSLSQKPIDLVSVQMELVKAGKINEVGGVLYLADLVDSVTSTISLEYNSRIIAEKSMARQLIALSATTIEHCRDETKDIFEILDLYESSRDDILNNMSQKKEVSNDKAMSEWMKKMELKSKLVEQDVTGIPTGFTLLNKNTGGWQNSDLVILAARPAMGKTALMLKFAVEAAMDGHPVMIFSLEMDKDKLINRIVSMITGIDIWKITKPSFLADHEWQKMHSTLGMIEKLPIIWDDSPSPTIVELSSKVKRNKRLHNIKFVCIDYLQLITPSEKKGQNREQEVSKISRGLKILAKEVDIPVLALSQLSRQCESRPGLSKRPMLSDLRESGAIEQDADQIMFIFRPEYYGLTEDEMGESTHGKAEIILAKNRNGETELINADFDGAKTNFLDPERLSPENANYVFDFMKVPEIEANEAIQARYEDDNNIDWGGFEDQEDGMPF